MPLTSSDEGACSFGFVVKDSPALGGTTVIAGGTPGVMATRTPPEVPLDELEDVKVVVVAFAFGSQTPVVAVVQTSLAA